MAYIINQITTFADVFQWLLLPFFIFISRVTDVSMSTIRLMFVWTGKKSFATCLGFFEALIWILAIGQIMKDISNISSYVAYAGGFAAGTFVGMYIEEKLAFGRVLIRIITKRKASQLIDYLKSNEFGVTSVDADGHDGKVNVVYTVIERAQVKNVVDIIKKFNPRAFYTVENVRFVSEGGILKERVAPSFFKKELKTATA